MAEVKKRKPGGGRKPSKPDYDGRKILQAQMEAAVALYNSEQSLQTIANELNLNPIKVRKLLITAGVYESEVADQVNSVFDYHRAAGLKYTDAIAATMRELNLSKASVTSYLSYEKGVYFPADESAEKISVGAERIHQLRRWKKVLEELLDKHTEEALWAAVVEFQGYKFCTYSGLPFSYSLKKGWNGAYTKELFIDRRESSKSLAWSSVRIAYEKVLEKRDAVFSRPKDIVDVRGISYSYSILWRFGVIRVPAEVEKRLKGENGKDV